MSLAELPAGFDFTDPDVYSQRLPDAELAELRRSAPVWWNEQPVGKGGYNDGGRSGWLNGVKHWPVQFRTSPANPPHAGVRTPETHRLS
jgi:hypothetical protein